MKLPFVQDKLYSKLGFFFLLLLFLLNLSLLPFSFCHSKSRKNDGVNPYSFVGWLKHPILCSFVCDGALSKFEILKEISETPFFAGRPQVTDFELKISGFVQHIGLLLKWGHHSVYPPLCWRVEPPTKVSKREGLDRTSTFRGSLVGKNRVTFQGRWRWGATLHKR